MCLITSFHWAVYCLPYEHLSFHSIEVEGVLNNYAVSIWAFQLVHNAALPKIFHMAI